MVNTCHEKRKEINTQGNGKKRFFFVRMKRRKKRKETIVHRLERNDKEERKNLKF